MILNECTEVSNEGKHTVITATFVCVQVTLSTTPKIIQHFIFM